MGYTAVRASLHAIEVAEQLASPAHRATTAPITTEQVDEQLALAIDKVMAEGGVVDRELAALAIRQAEGDLIEASFLLRAYRSTLPRLGYSATVSGAELFVLRRISSAFRDIPGGQYLGITRDYAQRLLDVVTRSQESGVRSQENGIASPPLPLGGGGGRGEGAYPGAFPVVVDELRREQMLAPVPPEPVEDEPFDITRTPPRHPMPRSGRLQALARGEAGGMLALAYSSMRGWGGAGHGTLAELRGGELAVRIHHPLTGKPATLGHIRITEVQYVSGGRASRQDADKKEYEFGYGIVPGRDERKAISMAILDATLRTARAGSTQSGTMRPVENVEFVLDHIDGIESSGFVEHLKLPHYVTFQSSMQRSRRFQQLLKDAANGQQPAPAEVAAYAQNGSQDQDDEAARAAAAAHEAAHAEGVPHTHAGPEGYGPVHTHEASESTGDTQPQEATHA